MRKGRQKKHERMSRRTRNECRKEDAKRIPKRARKDTEQKAKRKPKRARKDTEQKAKSARNDSRKGHERTRNKRRKGRETETERDMIHQKQVPGFCIFSVRTRIPPDPEFFGSRIPNSRIPTSGSRILGSRIPNSRIPGSRTGKFQLGGIPNFNQI